VIGNQLARVTWALGLGLGFGLDIVLFPLAIDLALSALNNNGTEFHFVIGLFDLGAGITAARRRTRTDFLAGAQGFGRECPREVDDSVASFARFDCKNGTLFQSPKILLAIGLVRTLGTL
jgi:hypothetical protein